ncbi:MAG: HAD family hydrolase [Rubripirellula sp.]
MVDRKIEFVYFDLGNVLLSFDPQAACKNVASLFQVSVDQARAAVYESGVEDRFEKGEVSPEQFADAVRSELGAAVPTQAILDGMSDMFWPIEAMQGVLQSVRDRGCGVGLLSNTCHAHFDWVRRQKYAVTDFRFDAVIVSYEVGAMKPDAAIYHAAEQAIDVPCDRILFLDDKPENIEAALQRGWNAVNCFGGQGALETLQSFGVIGEST